MLTRKTPEVLATEVTIIGQGQEPIKFQVVFHNRDPLDVEAYSASVDNDPAKLLLHLVKEWDSEYALTIDDVQEMERARPGLILALFEAWRDARRVTKVKN